MCIERETIDKTKLKTCHYCYEKIPLNEFEYIKKQNKHKMTNRCINCRNKYYRDYRINNLEKMRAISRKSRKKHSKERHNYSVNYNKKTGYKNAVSLVRKAVVNGKLKDLRKNWVKCTDCDKRAIMYKHKDYNKPLEAEPLCNWCARLRGPAIPLKRYSTVEIEKAKEIVKSAFENYGRKNLILWGIPESTLYSFIRGSKNTFPKTIMRMKEIIENNKWKFNDDHIIRECLNCRKKYKPKSHKQKFCHDSCGIEFRKKKYR